MPTYKNRVQETTTATGTGTITLQNSAPSGYQTFSSALGGNATVEYCIVHQTLNEWEVGEGTFTNSGTTLSRSSVYASSNSNSLVNFSAGIKNVFLIIPAEKILTADSIISTSKGGTGSSTTFTQGSVVYAGSSGIYTEDHNNFNWDSTNRALTVASKVNIGIDGSFQGALRLYDGAGSGRFVSVTVPTISATYAFIVPSSAGTAGYLLYNTDGAGSTGWLSTVPVANGGTGATSITNHGVVLGQGASAITATSTGTSGQLLRSGGSGADPSWTTPTYPTSSASSGKVIISDGTNFVASTPTYPNASATTNKIIKSDGTNFVASTETYAAPGTSGNIMQSDGTNWTSAANTGGWNVLKISGSDFTRTAQTLADITGLSFSATASTLYEIEATLYCTSSSNAGIEFGVNSTGSSPSVFASFLGQTSATAAAVVSVSANGSAEGTAFLTASNSGIIKVWAVVSSGTGTPTISLQGLKVTSGTLTVKQGSVMRYRILGS